MNGPTQTAIEPGPRPTALRLSPDNIPPELKAIEQWVVWRYELAKDKPKWTKPPLNARTGRNGSSTDPTTWCDYETALSVYQEGGWDGIGFALTREQQIIGIDLDHCIDENKAIAPWAQTIIKGLNSYTEVSPSGTGVHIYLKGEKEGGGRKHGNIEVYPEGRYLTFTGRVLKAYQVRTIEPRQAELDAFLLEHFPPKPKAENRAGAATNGNGHLSDHEILEIGLRAKNGDKLRSLLDGNCDGYPSPSEADMALCSLLTFYTQDEAQIDRLYRGSKLFRDKWNDKHYGDGATYGERTIEKAIAGTVEHYTGAGGGVNSHNSLNSQSLQAQPMVDLAAYHGLAGEIVTAISPYSESDPVAILVNVLTAFGSVIGSGPHFGVEKSEHHLNIFGVQVGQSAKGRKGQAVSTPKFMFKAVDSDWGEKRIRSGLSSGEGLVYAVRDARYEKRPIREKGRTVDYERVLVDEGEEDKRLLCIEEEFSQCLKVMSREGNILSPILRDAWDGKKLAPMTKNSPIEATGAHVSIIAHITRGELLRYFASTEQTNGFGNRFMWFFVKRSKEIPTPTGCPDETLNLLIEKLGASVSFARKIATIIRDDEAEAVWRSVYHDLSAEKDGLVGALLARSEPQVMRLASIYALLDSSNKVESSHLEAALALWAYVEQSCRFIFGELKGDPGVDSALEALKQAGSLTTTAIHNLFGRHADKGEVDRVVRELLKIEGVTSETIEDTGGRHALTLVWSAKKAN